MANILPDNETITFEDQEIWKDIPEWEGLYQASNLGRIKRLPLEMIYSDGQQHFYPEKIYNPSISGNGYKTVKIRKPNEDAKTVFVHKLVADTFLERKDGDEVVNHIDLDKTNNRIDNLEWTTYSNNSIHYVENRRVVGDKKVKPVICIETGIEFPSSATAARELSDLTTNLRASAKNIWAAANGDRPTALGFHWKFKEDE